MGHGKEEEEGVCRSWIPIFHIKIPKIDKSTNGCVTIYISLVQQGCTTKLVSLCSSAWPCKISRQLAVATSAFSRVVGKPPK